MNAAVLIIGGMALSTASLADVATTDSADRIAAHFEASSSRLRAEDIRPLDLFAQRAENMPGAKLAILVPNTTEPAHSRFVAARIAELERHLRGLSDLVEYQRVAEAGRGDLLWLTIKTPEPVAVPQPTSLIPPLVSAPLPEPRAQTTISKPVAAATDLQLTDWVVRGVKHPVHGPAYAYVARVGSTAVPREVVESQTDKDLGFIKEISLSPDGLWVVRTEIGWIGQVAP
jgi:hypothetical protein